MSHAATHQLLRARVRGLHIDAQSGESGVVHLVIRTDQEKRGPIWNLRKHLANALFRAGDACHPGYDHRGARVVGIHVSAKTVNDQLPDFAHADGMDVVPLYGANGDAHYSTLFVHERVEHHKQSVGVELRSVFGLQERTDNSHGQRLQVADFSGCEAPIVLADEVGTERSKGGAA